MAEWSTDKYIYLLLAGLPLFVLPGGYTCITATKYGYFLVLTLLWLLLLLISAIRDRKAPALLHSEVEFSLCALLLFAIISCLLSDFPFQSTFLGLARYDGLSTLLLYLLLFFGVSRHAKPKVGYFLAFSVAMLLSCLVAFFQLGGGNPLGLFPGSYRYADAGIAYSGAYLGLSGNVDVLGALLCMAVPLGFFAALLIAARKIQVPRILALPFFLSGAACLFVLYKSGVAGAALAAAGGAVLSLPLLAAAMRGKPHSLRTLLLFALVLLLLAAAVLVFVYFTSAESGTIYELSRILHGEAEDSFGSSRILIWRNVLALFAEKPLFGGGSGTISARLDIHFSRFVPETGITLESSVDNAHCVYLGILADNGIFAFAAALAAHLFALVSLRKKEGDALFVLCGCCFLSGAIEALFGLGLCLTAPVFWLNWALCCADCKSSNQLEDSHHEKRNSSHIRQASAAHGRGHCGVHAHGLQK